MFDVADGGIAHVPHGAVRSRDVPAAPPLPGWCAMVDDERAELTDRPTVGGCELAAHQHAWHVEAADRFVTAQTAVVAHHAHPGGGVLREGIEHDALPWIE